MRFEFDSTCLWSWFYKLTAGQSLQNQVQRYPQNIPHWRDLIPEQLKISFTSSSDDIFCLPRVWIENLNMLSRLNLCKSDELNYANRAQFSRGSNSELLCIEPQIPQCYTHKQGQAMKRSLCETLKSRSPVLWKGTHSGKISLLFRIFFLPGHLL